MESMRKKHSKELDAVVVAAKQISHHKDKTMKVFNLLIHFSMLVYCDNIYLT